MEFNVELPRPTVLVSLIGGKVVMVELLSNNQPQEGHLRVEPPIDIKREKSDL